MPTLRTTLTWDGQEAPEAEVATVTLTLTTDGLRVGVEAPFHGDAPPAAPPGPTPRLWEHEAVELFLGEAAAPNYLEVELGPHGHHLVLRLRGVRQPVEQALPLPYRAERLGGRWRGEAVVPAAWLPAGAPETWRANATAVHGPPEARRHLSAARLRAAQPDFHRPDEWLPAGW